jgi:hypothetical protein
MHAFAGATSAVDMYNSVTGAWTTAQLSVARHSLAATSVGNMALFAGGVQQGALWPRDETLEGGLLVFVSDVFSLFGMCGAMA